MSKELSAALWQEINARPRKVFLQLCDNSYSYQDLGKGIRNWCSLFDSHGVAAGSRVLIICDDELLASTVFLAALLDNKVPVMLNPDSRLDRLTAVCRVTEPALVVAENLETASQLQDQGFPSVSNIFETPTVSRTFLGRFRGSSLPSYPQRDPGLSASGEALAYILFTSGTTGEPSGVEITHAALQAHLTTLSRLFSYSTDSCIANPTPLSHTDGLTQGLLLALYNGACLLRPGKFALDELERWLDQFSRYGASHFITNPTTIALIEEISQHDDYFNFEGFKAVISSASILRSDLWNAFEKHFGCRLFNLYGMTETVANATYAGRHPEMGKVGTIGLPIDCEARVVNPADGTTQVSGNGELQLRGAHLCRGYWRNPERTQRVFVPDGWFRTGDLVSRDPEGNLEFVGRLKSVINSGGLSIAPEEIDEVLLAHFAVTESATVGLPHPEFEEIAVSAVVTRQPITPGELLAHARQSLEPLKVPKKIIQVSSIPRGGAGKPDLARLKVQLQEMTRHQVSEDEARKSELVSMSDVINLAARVFNVAPNSLNADTSPATLSTWDSFNHLTLVVEAEATFEKSIPTAAIASISTLRELHETLCCD